MSEQAAVEEYPVPAEKHRSRQPLTGNHNTGLPPVDPTDDTTDGNHNTGLPPVEPTEDPDPDGNHNTGEPATAVPTKVRTVADGNHNTGAPVE